MALATKTPIDKRLTELYADKITVNLDCASAISPEVVWQTMQIVAINNKALVKINYK